MVLELARRMGCVLEEDPEDTVELRLDSSLYIPGENKEGPMFSRLWVLDEVKWVLEGS